jgi:hypothetical protein
MIDFNNFPKYSERRLINLLEDITPVYKWSNCWVKRDDLFSLGGVCGGKVRQLLNLVWKGKINLKYPGLITACGLPSPQSVITSAVAKYFGMKSAVVTYQYSKDTVDINRLNISIAQRFGAQLYGHSNPRPPALYGWRNKLAQELGYYVVDFGMSGKDVLDVIADQCANIPNWVRRIVIISGSGLSALGVMLGCGRFADSVEEIVVVGLSDKFWKNKVLWYDPLTSQTKFKGELKFVHSPIAYTVLFDKYDKLDYTYESKAYQYMIDNKLDGDFTLFWVVGKREYDMSYYVKDINWISWKKEEVRGLEL